MFLSIVDDALQKLGKAGHSNGLGDGSGEYSRLKNSSVAHELYQGRASSSGRKPWAAIAGLAMLGLGLLVWGIMDRATPMPIKPLTPVVKEIGIPVTTVIAATTGTVPAPAALASNDPIAELSPARAVVMEVVKPPFAVPPQSLVESITLPSQIVPPWLSQGWKLVEQARSVQAVEAWETGLKQLPDKNSLAVYALAHTSLEQALVQARRLGATAPAIVVRESTGSDIIYRVLLLGNAQVSPLAIKNHLLAGAPYLWVGPAPDFSEKNHTSNIATAIAAKHVGSTSPMVTPVVSVASAKYTAPVVSVAVQEPLAVEFSMDDSASHALDALTRGDMADARRLADVLIGNQPSRWEGHFVLGSVLLASGRAREAEAPLDRALGLNSNSVRVLLQRAIAAQEAGQPRKAVIWLRQARTLAPDNASVLLNLGYSSELSGATGEAVSAYQRYLQVTSDRSGAETQRAYVTERLRVMRKP